MARPKKPTQELRDETVRMRVNSVERAQIEHSASMLSLTLSDFLRNRALGYRLPSSTKLDRKQMDSAVVALMRLGVNLNQLTKHANAGRGMPTDELADLIARINQAMDELDDSNCAQGRTT